MFFKIIDKINKRSFWAPKCCLGSIHCLNDTTIGFVVQTTPCDLFEKVTGARLSDIPNPTGFHNCGWHCQKKNEDKLRDENRRMLKEEKEEKNKLIANEEDEEVLAASDSD